MTVQNKKKILESHVFAYSKFLVKNYVFCENKTVKDTKFWLKRKSFVLMRRFKEKISRELRFFGKSKPLKI